MSAICTNGASTLPRRKTRYPASPLTASTHCKLTCVVETGVAVAALGAPLSVIEFSAAGVPLSVVPARVGDAVRELHAIQVDRLTAEVLQLDVLKIIVVVGAARRRLGRVVVQFGEPQGVLDDAVGCRRRELRRVHHRIRPMAPSPI